MIRSTVVAAWIVFSLLWAAMCLFVLLLGAGMSVGDSHIQWGFLAYLIAPIALPYVLYKIFGRFFKTQRQDRSE